MMGQLSSKLRSMAGDQIAFWCPGCEEVHAIRTGAGGWGYNGKPDAPTFTPSVLVTSGHYVPGHDKTACWCTYNADQRLKGEEPAPFKCERCHSFVTDGHIQFLADSTHALAGQTVPLPDWPADQEPC